MGCGLRVYLILGIHFKAKEEELKSSPITDKKDFKIRYADMVTNKKNRVHDDYKISGKVMGKGAFGEVVLAVHKSTGDKRALKKIPKKDMSKPELESLLNEVNVLKQLVKNFNS